MKQRAMKRDQRNRALLNEVNNDLSEDASRNFHSCTRDFVKQFIAYTTIVSDNDNSDLKKI